MRILREPGIRRQEKLEKRLKPFYDSYGMVRYYPVNGETYKKGEAVYDRDGDYLYFRYDDLLDTPIFQLSFHFVSLGCGK